MARSRPRTPARAKAVQARSLRLRRLEDLAIAICGANPPEVEAANRTAEEIEGWFREDPAAPMVLLAYAPADEETRSCSDAVLVAINTRVLTRELRARGIDEDHPDWDRAYHLTVETVLAAVECLITIQFSADEEA